MEMIANGSVGWRVEWNTNRIDSILRQIDFSWMKMCGARESRAEMREESARIYAHIDEALAMAFYVLGCICRYSFEYIVIVFRNEKLVCI